MSDRTGRDATRRGAERARRHPRHVGIEPLEARAMLTASLAPIANITSPAALGYQVPLDGSASNLASQTYSVTSTNPAIKATIAQGHFMTLNVSHASSGAGDLAYSGPMTFQLFEDLTPLTASKIENLVNIGFYSGRNFHRISSGFPDANGFIAQGGSVDGAGGGIGSTNQAGTVPVPTVGYPFPDEFNQQLVFDGTGQLAMANSGRDSNETQFFITSAQPTSLNFGYTLFGQLVAGQGIYNDVIHTQLTASTTTPASPITINSASLSATSPDGVIHVDTTGATQGQTGQVTVTATDPTTKTTAPQTFTVTVGPNLPAGQTTPNRPFLQLGTTSYTVGQGQPAIFKVNGVATTPGDPLTYTAQGSVTTSSTTGTSSFVPIPATTGTATVDANGVVTFTPAAGFKGNANFLVGVRDATDRTGTGTLESPGNYDYHTYTVNVNTSATPIGLQPIASPVSVSTPVNGSSQIQLAGQSANPGTTGSTLTYTLLSQPAHGTLTALNATTGAVTYTPTTNYAGPDSFTYDVTSVGGPAPTNQTSAPAAVTINVTQSVVRLLGRTLIVSPPPSTARLPSTVAVTETGGNVVVTINGVTDVTRPAATALDKIIVYGGNTGNNIGVDPSVTVPTFLSGGHGGKNFIRAGGAPSRIHGWFGTNLVAGGSAPNVIVGRKGHITVLPSTGADTVFLSGINPANRVPHFKGDKYHGPKPDLGSFYKFVGNKLVRTNTPVNQPLSQATTTTTTTG